MELKERQKRVPDLWAKFVPGVSAAGFMLREELAQVKEQIGQWDLCDVNTQVGAVLARNEVWVVKEGRRMGGGISTTLYFKNRLVRLDFGDKGRLYQIVVGAGYEDGFHGVKVGDDVRSLEKDFVIEFESSEDAFFIANEKGEYMPGISFTTDHWAPSEEEPNQADDSSLIGRLEDINRKGMPCVLPSGA